MTPFAFLPNIGATEMMVVAFVSLLIFGNRLPSVMRSLGKSVTEFKKGVSGIANWKISDAVDAKLILAWRNWNGRFATDQSDAPLDVSLVDGIQSFTYRTVELRFSGDALSNKLNWTAGGFYYDGDSRSAQSVNLPGAGNTAAYLANPQANALLVNGLDVWADPPAAKAVIGVVPAEARLFERLSGEEMLEYAGRLRGLADVPARPRSRAACGGSASLDLRYR